jgi:hypothetical protein
MPIETPFQPEVFAGTISASVIEHGGVLPQSIIRTDQSWAVVVNWTNTGLATGMIGGKYDLHLLLERVGPGEDLDLTDPADHYVPLMPGPSPVNYSRHIDIAPGAVPDGVYKLVVVMRYIEPGGAPGPMSAYVEITPLLEFYTP